ncbi:MAG: hypothetical protein K6D02_07915 [Lachnospiraceae bacterium]|nr:hypothetical protein [Lachnospiraceae bacterium]
MKTDVILVSATGAGVDEALNQSEKFADYQSYSAKDKIRLRLIAEESLGMVKTFSDDYDVNFYIEGDEKKCTVVVEADVDIDSQVEDELLALSTTGKNDAAKGFMGKMKVLFFGCVKQFNDIYNIKSQYPGGNVDFAEMGMYDNSAISVNSYMWSLTQYRDQLFEEKDSNEGSKEAWDELEKSIVASIADEVKVGVVGNKVTLKVEYTAANN